MVYINDWQESGKSGMCSDFQIDEKQIDDCDILLATYRYEGYEGDAFVLFRKDGKLFEVNGGHCSCYGLEGQWEPEETTIDALLKRKWWRDENGCIESLLKIAIQQ